MHSEPPAVVEPPAHDQPGAAVQFTHSVAPGGAYMPTPHADDAGFGTVEPGGHTYPASQGRQSLTPPVEYLPATHTVPADVVDAAPHDHPAMAVQLEHVEEPATENRPTLQVTAVGDVEPAAGHT
jgi:hypothetical protein